MEVTTVEYIFNALQQPDAPMLHFLPTRGYEKGVSLESYEGELKPLPLAQLRELLERAAPRRPSLVFMSSRHSVEAGQLLVDAGVPVVVALKGFLNELSTTAFVHTFYKELLTGSPPARAFASATATQREHDSTSLLPSPTGEFVLLTQEGAELRPLRVPATGALRDLSQKLCPSNLPFSGADDFAGPASAAADERVSSSSDLATMHAEARAAGSRELAREDMTGVELDPELGYEAALAHGAAFVGRHLEMHQLLHSILNNQLTAVHGEVHRLPAPQEPSAHPLCTRSAPAPYPLTRSTPLWLHLGRWASASRHSCSRRRATSASATASPTAYSAARSRVSSR